MLQSIWDDIKQEFGYGNAIKRIIIVNIIVYVVVNLVWVFMVGNYAEQYESAIHFFSVGSDWKHNLFHPWVVVTHMFLHESFWHILWNMLFLFWFGRIFGDLLGDRRVLPLYLLGGMAGAVVYFVAANVGGVPGTSFALGASAAVMAILVAAGVFAPNYGIHLLFLGEVKLKWIVLALIFMNVLSTRGMENVGGAWGHLGGIAMGFAFAYQLQRGNDWSQGLNRKILDPLAKFWDNLQRSRQSRRPGPRPAFRHGQQVGASTAGKNRTAAAAGRRTENRTHSNTHQEQLDAILDKIKDKGYDSLSKEEKEFLFRASEK